MTEPRTITGLLSHQKGNPLETNDATYIEWRAWQLVIEQWKKLHPGEEPDADWNNAFWKSVAAWGELLAELRSTQDDHVVERARQEALVAMLRAGVNPTREP